MLPSRVLRSHESPHRISSLDECFASVGLLRIGMHYAFRQVIRAQKHTPRPSLWRLSECAFSHRASVSNNVSGVYTQQKSLPNCPRAAQKGGITSVAGTGWEHPSLGNACIRHSVIQSSPSSGHTQARRGIRAEQKPHASLLRSLYFGDEKSPSRRRRALTDQSVGFALYAEA